MKRLTILPILLFVLVFVFSSAVLAASIDIQGSTTVLPITQILAEEYMDLNPDIDITVSGGGSGVGIAALIDGMTPLAQSSRPIRQSEIEQAAERGIEVVEIVIAKDALSCVVHPSIPLEEISIDMLQQIYTGQITNWSKLTGTDQQLVVVSRDTASGTFEVWNEYILQGEELAPEVLRLPSNQAILNEVANNPNAIGYIGLGYVSGSVKPLIIDGVEPTVENALSGTYPISRSLYFYAAGEPEGEIKDFVDFTLSEAGQQIVAEEGFVPVQ